MDVHFIPTDLLLVQEGWFSAARLMETQISPIVRQGLECEGLLTTALQKAYHSPSSVECRRQIAWLDEQGGTGLRRDVLIKASESICVTAATLMPSRVIECHPWLTAMGNNPLGEMLAKHDCSARGAFEFGQLNAEVIFGSSLSGVPRLWARRYRFFLAESFLLVTEVFFPGVLERLGTTF